LTPSKGMLALPKISIGRFFLFILWPFGGLLASIKNFRKPWSRTLFWLFCIYFGYVFIYADPDGWGNADSARYAQQLIDAHNSSSYSFNALLAMFYNPKNGVTDIYQPLVTWFVSIFTDNPSWLFFVLSTVFGLFYAQNLWMVFSRVNSRVTFILFLFMFALSLVVPIWNINGARMYTAAHVFIYGVLRYYLQNDKKGLIWAGVSVLFHFSFFFPVVLFFSFLLVPSKLLYLFVFFIGSSFVKEIDLGAIRHGLEFVPDVFTSKVHTYTSEAYFRSLQSQQKGYAWHVVFAGQAMDWVGYAWIITVFIYRRYWINQLPKVTSLFAFALFFGGFAQLASLIPSGARFLALSNFLFLSIFILIINSKLIISKIRVLQYITYPLIGFSIVFLVRVGLDYIGVLAFLGNPIVALIVDDQTPIIEMVKQLIQ